MSPRERTAIRPKTRSIGRNRNFRSATRVKTML